ncbi:DUF814 domain-containing protein [bacterium]|nr:DUF814 domain-containing protein [bacterium]
MLSEIEQNILIGAKIKHGFKYPFGGWLEMEHRYYGKFSLCWFHSGNKREMFLTPPLLKYNVGWCNACEGFFISSISSSKNVMALDLSDNEHNRSLIFEIHSGNAIATDSDGKILWTDNKRAKVGEIYSFADDAAVNRIVREKLDKSQVEQILADGLRKFELFKNKYFETEIIHRLKSEIKRVKKAIAAVHKDMEKLGKSDRMRKTADAIMANLHNIPSRASSAEIIDPYTGKMITVHLDPKISVQKNAEMLYVKARRAERGIFKVEKRIIELNDKLSQLEKLLQNADFRTIAQSLGIALHTLLGKPVSLQKPQKTHDYGSGIKKFVSSDGFIILVGRNAKSNNRLTFEIAAKDDIWLHAEHIKGSHTVIKLAGAKDCPKRTLEQAASLTAFYSDAKHSSLVPVIYTRKRYVHSIKGKLGLVRLDRSETIFVEPKRL